MIFALLKKIPGPVLASVVLIGCQLSDVTDTSPKNIFTDTILREIYDAQDKRDSGSLYRYMDHENALYREHAALAFASLQDPAAIRKLFSMLLKDTHVKARVAAAYSLGQTYDSGAVDLLFEALEIEDSLLVRRNILEALGKCITMQGLSRLNTMAPSGDLEKEGLAWGLYRAGIRNVYDGLSTSVCVDLLDPGNSYRARLGAAHFLARVKGLDLSGYTGTLVEAVHGEASPFIRMALASALGKTGGNEKALASLSALSEDPDYRVRINACRSLGGFKGEEVKKILIKGTKDESVQGAVAAAEELLKSFDLSAEELPPLSTVNWRVWATLASATLKKNRPDSALVNTIVINTVKDRYRSSENPWEKAALLSALGSTLAEYEYLVTEIFSTKLKAVSTAGIMALAHLRAREDFPRELEEEFAEIFKQAVLSGDLAMIGIAAEVLKTEKYGYREVYKDIRFLHDARGLLSLPKDNEALQVLDETIAFFEGKEAKPVINAYNNPIDWTMIEGLEDNSLVKISTGKGDIVIRLLVNKSPGSVVNFLKLMKKGYYDGIAFHRVAPNFVVQGGCNRGDGWGGEDFSSRSELGPHLYEEGAVGMASAGKDTEGTQWFITHSPTPHLDGKYTIFARVTKGMEIVHLLEQGDKIITMALTGENQ
ncbi:MAG: peptidylprolyl isomerase [Cyclobacteriaceae bacterium]|nr:peptidylprolyl isomerase [Cyclobacteriaceae bacterium]